MHTLLLNWHKTRTFNKCSGSFLPFFKLSYTIVRVLRLFARLIMLNWIFFKPQIFILKQLARASLLVQWFRIYLTVWETLVWSLVGEDPTCHRAPEPMCHNWRSCTLKPISRNTEACAPRQERPPQWETLGTRE